MKKFIFLTILLVALSSISLAEEGDQHAGGKRCTSADQSTTVPCAPLPPPDRTTGATTNPDNPPVQGLFEWLSELFDFN